MTTSRRHGPEHDVVVVGGGPGGSGIATHLARGGLDVALFEREAFPRFRVGESLMPATMLLLERLGALEAVRAGGFQLKQGAVFHDQERGKQATFYFLRGMPWPHWAYNVTRAEFDTILLDHARKQGVQVHQPAAVEQAAIERDGVMVTARMGDETIVRRARFLVDASGRDGFLARRLGRTTRRPNLGKVAFFAHYRGARRFPGDEEGHIRLYLFDAGWFWWIPLAGDVTSIGAVLHARTVRERAAPPQAILEEMIQRCHAVRDGLAGAERIMPVQTAANFSYVNSPVVGDRFLAVGDAITFLDPIFSAGVFVSLHTAELAAQAILQAFATGRFEAARFAAYERRVWRGLRPLFRFITRYYEPAFLDLFLGPKNVCGTVTSVLNVLSGGSFIRMPWRVRFGLGLLFTLTRLRVLARRATGLPVESRLEW